MDKNTLEDKLTIEWGTALETDAMGKNNPSDFYIAMLDQDSVVLDQVANGVYNILFKSIENGKIENACNWLTECICSGYIL